MASKIENLTAISCKAGFGYLDKKNYQPLVKAGLAEINEAMTEGNKVATRITEAGAKMLADFNTEPKTAEVSAPVHFEIMDNVEMPKSTRSGGTGRASKYPFDALQVGQMFFVPESPKQLEPAKSLGSVVNAANRKYAVETGNMRINRKGKEVPELRLTRKFVLRPYSKLDAEGERIHGAGVWREA